MGRRYKSIDEVLKSDLYQAILSDLYTSGVVRVTGSYADGTQTIVSDIDFYIKEDEPDVEFEDRNIERIKDIMETYDIECKSSVMGHIGTHNINANLPIALEFSDLFNKREGKFDEVNLGGFIFKTY